MSIEHHRRRSDARGAGTHPGTGAHAAGAGA